MIALANQVLQNRVLWLTALPMMVALGCTGGSDESNATVSPERVLIEIDRLTALPRQPNSDTGSSPTQQSHPSASNQSGSLDAAVRESLIGKGEEVKEVQAVQDDPREHWMSLDTLPRDVWEVQYRGNEPIGYTHRRVEASIAEGSHLVRVEAESRMRVRTGDKLLDQRFRISTIERDNGELVSIDGVLELGEGRREFKGFVASGGLRLTNTLNGQSSLIVIPWDDSFRGPFAVEQSMVRRPLLPGETRKLKLLDPSSNSVIEAVLQAGAYFPTPVMTGSAPELLEVRCTIQTANGSLPVLHWVDESGESLKSYQQQLDTRTFRVDRESARLIRSMADADSFEHLEIPCSGATSQWIDATESKYIVSNQAQNPFRLFSNRVNQRTRAVDPHTVQVTVVQTVSKEMMALSPTSDGTPDESTRKRTTTIDFDHPQVVELAKLFLGAAKVEADADVPLRAGVLQRSLFEWLPVKDFDRRVASASQTVQRRSGDCAEHAILLTALCRANDIPARLVSGLVWNHSIEHPTMRFHMWVEAHDGTQWIGLDSTQDRFPIPTDRVKMLESPLSSNNPYDLINPVLETIQQIQIELAP